MAALLGSNAPLQAQDKEKPGFEIVKGDNAEEVIYKGTCTFNDLTRVDAFHLRERSGEYRPDSRQAQALAANLKHYQLVVFLGTWCEDSHRMIPQLYRVLNDVSYPMDQLKIYALDRAKTGRNGEEKKYNITNVPTIIVLEHDKEKGRITETVQQSVEGDLVKIIEKESE